MARSHRNSRDLVGFIRARGDKRTAITDQFLAANAVSLQLFKLFLVNDRLQVFVGAAGPWMQNWRRSFSPLNDAGTQGSPVATIKAHSSLLLIDMGPG
jgi:hypothetical protein